MADRFNEAISAFPESIKTKLLKIPTSVKSDTYEIRVRKNKPLVLFGAFGSAFVDCNSIVSHLDYRNGIVISELELHHIISEVCGYSIYSHQSEILNGFVTYGKGFRVGFCATAVADSDKIIAVNSITSLNIRISRDIDGCVKEILSMLFRNISPKGILIAGAPCTGKTTVLKSMAKILSSEHSYDYKKCVVIDERFEMSTVSGINCDILSGYGKESGITHAIRTLSPEIIICDEISTETEAEKIMQGFDTGVAFIASVHASDKNELLRRKVSYKLISSGCFDYTVILRDVKTHSYEILKTGENFNEDSCNRSCSLQFTDDSLYDNNA